MKTQTLSLVKGTILFLLISLHTSAISQTIDETFNAPRFLRRAPVYTIVEMSDGDLLMQGDFKFVGNETLSTNLVKINPDGTLDSTFHPVTGLNSPIIAKNGDIIGFDGRFLIRLDPNGNLRAKSEAINEGTQTHEFVEGDHIVIATFTGIRCYDKKLKLDKKFNNRDGILDGGSISSIQPQDKKILVGGYFQNFDGHAINSLVRLNSDGTVDTTFTSPFGPATYIGSMLVQHDGKIVFANSSLYDTNGSPIQNLIRLNADGTLDNSFSPAISETANRIFQHDQTLLVETFTSATRLNLDGSLDPSFSPVPMASNYFKTSALTSTNQFIVSGIENVFTPFGIVKFNASGTIDETFAPQISRPGMIKTVSLQQDKLLVGGEFFQVGDFFAPNIARLFNDGTLDSTFTPVTTNASVQKIATTSDAIFVGYGFMVLKFDNNGNQLPFNNSTGIAARKFALLPDGKLYIADANGIARVYSDGTSDTSFTPFIFNCCSWNEFDFDIQSDGKVILAPDPFSSHGLPSLIRLNQDGTRDETFNEVTGLGEYDVIFDVEVVDNDAIVLTGFLSAYQGTPIANNVIKLSNNGLLDVNFQNGFAQNQSMYVSVRSKEFRNHLAIVIYGENGNTQGGLQFYDANGALATEAFLTASITSIWGEHTEAFPGSDNSLYVVGEINVAYSVAPLNIVRLVYPEESIATNATQPFEIYPNPADTYMRIHVVTPAAVTVRSVTGFIEKKYHVNESTDIDISELPKGKYLVTVQQGGMLQTSHLWKN